MTTRRHSRPPRYRLHKASGKAIVTLDGKMIYLGTYDSPESRAKDKRELAAWLSKPSSLTSKKTKVCLSLQVIPLLSSMK